MIVVCTSLSLTFYKVGIIGRVAKRPLVTNTKHKTHNNQHEPPPPYLPAALPSTSMGRSLAPTTHGAAAHWLACLGGAKQHTSKNREEMVHWS
jgi:hypothetical protein